jgi:antitoxin (DNA-binding transcriptional repressor) of toxin-antitoxin stability system
LVITSNGKPIAILSAVSEETLEEAFKSNRTTRAVAAVETMQRRSLRAGTDRMAGEEIEAENAAVRKKRSRRLGYLTSSVTYSVTVKRHEPREGHISACVARMFRLLRVSFHPRGGRVLVA